MRTIENISHYISELNQIFKTGNATEHSYRPALKSLLEELTRGYAPVLIANEPKRITCGAPDYIVSQNEIPIGYIEAKDIDTDLNHKTHKEQFERYKQSLNNLIITDYLTFQLFVNGDLITSVSIAKTGKNGITEDKTQFDAFATLMDSFVGYEGQPIIASLQLSKIMATKARLMANIIEKALDEDENFGAETTNNSTIYNQLKGFREVLIETMTHKEFADIYAQTIAYGMFAAYLTPHSPKQHTSPPTPLQNGERRFTRQQAAQLIPHSNPFLRQFFDYIAGINLDKRICWIVDDLANLFNYVSINDIYKEFEKYSHDPMIHFYETFLGEYDPTLRRSRGVWYTPQPIVKFMVKAVDDILKQEFEIAKGLADCSYLTPLPPLLWRGGEGEPGYFTSPKSNWINLLKKAKEGRKNQTEAENLIWQNLRNRKLGDKFRRQHPIGEFIPDFVCLEKRLVVEVDGGYHNEKEQQEYDAQRTEYLKDYGYSVIRFTNDAVLHDTKNVILQIQKYLTPLPPLQRREGEGDIQNSPLSFGEGTGVRYHRVQVLDPATGTGTFLSEVIQNIYQNFENQQGMWQSYVSEHLIPRINGFEILMASYAMAHLKLDMLLRQTGYAPKEENSPLSFGEGQGERLRIFLTNSLDEAKGEDKSPFVEWLKNEANQANRLKKNVPVMVVIGNPPYSAISQNNGYWITKLIQDYKLIGTSERINEKKHWLNDDYVKFIRFGQYFIEKKGSGILAYINNHSFLDNPTFRAMRWQLLHTFDKIYIIDLHGNAKKKETAPNGGKDENVFDIQQGVSINIFVKTNLPLPPPKEGNLTTSSKGGELAQVFHADLYGKRIDKYNFLLENELYNIKWQVLEPKTPYYFFVPKSENNKEEYEKGFAINEIFNVNVTGIVTMGDAFIISDDKTVLKDRIYKLVNNLYSINQLNEQFGLGKNYAQWILQNKTTIKIEDKKFVKINYRPFDEKWTYFDNNLIWRRRENVMQHFLKGENVENVGLMLCRQQKTNGFYHCLIHNNIVESSFVSNKTSEIGYSFPLYLYLDGGREENGERRPDIKEPNLKWEIVKEIAERLGVEFTPIDILDYIYAVLHSPKYREKYKEFLKIDFPRVPYPENAEQFWKLVALGGKLRRLHLMEDVEAQKGMADFPVAGSNIVEKVEISLPSPNGERQGVRLHINEKQYFDKVPLVAWNFYIGGYQPAQKWLKDRKGRTLNYDDIVHYQKIIRVLKATDEIMKKL